VCRPSPPEYSCRAELGKRRYGAFSLSPSQLDTVVQCVKAQQEHHRTPTFQEEYCELFRRFAKAIRRVAA
jgi:hypothetical protein